MKKYLLLFFVFSFLFLSNSFSQGFNGLSSGNYSGITGVMLQPASIVDSRFKFDINLFSTDVNFSNNYFLLDRKVILKFNKNNFDDYTTFKNEYLSQASLSPGQKVFFNINSRTQIPLSFMATTGKKSAIAFNMQLRSMIEGRGITQDFANLAYNNFYHPPLNNTTVDASGINIKSLSWAEVGLTYGRVLYSSPKHFFKAAVTGKYLAGLSSLSLSSNDLRLQVNGSDSTFNFTSPNVSYNHNEDADFNKLFDKNFSPDANSFGLDAGLVYEYRGNLDHVKYIRNNDETSYDRERRDLNKYIFKLGVSLLDVGMFTFNKPADVNSFSADINNWDIKNAHYNSIKEFDTALAARVIANPNDPRKYDVHLPTALSAQLDIRFVKGLFLNVMSYWPVSLGSNDGQRFNKYGFYTITPRYERRHFGIYIPYTVSQRNGFTDYDRHLLGLTLRAGPMFIGSSNLGTMLFNKNLRAADVHLGFKVGFTYGKPNKSDKLLEVFKHKNERVISVDSISEKREEYYVNPNQKSENKIEKDRDRIILDYKDGKIYDVPNSKGNIIILNNNYYYGNAPAVRKSDTVTVENFTNEYVDSLQRQRFMINQLQNKMTADSISRITSDSLRMKRIQLDSLIRSMQQLQNQMDSINNESGFINNNDSIKNQSIVKTIKSSNDSLHNVIDSLQNLSASIKRSETAQKINDTRNGVTVQKADSVQKPDITQDTSNVQKTDTTQENIIAFNNNEIDTSSGLKKKDNLVTDTLSPIKYESEMLTSNENSTRELNKLSNAQEENNKKNAQLLQQQNDLYRQYAEQSASLANDINRLNTRMATARQYNARQPNVVYKVTPGNVPNNPPNNNYGYNTNNQLPVVAKSEKKRDTVYIRDTVIKFSIDTVPHNIDTSTHSEITKKPKTEEATHKPGFNYAGMPAEIILFGIGKWEVQPIYDNRLNFIANILNENPGLAVTVTGHTDATGSKEINERLSLRRAESVAAYLIEKGVAVKQIILKSLSFGNPAVKGNTQTARTQNRRVMVKLVNK
ncbi:MAG: OmpA family protein [Ginsengibacter sp.]